MVEDNPGITKTVATACAVNGYELLSAGSLALGRKKIQEGLPSLVLLDINLPDGSGLDLCKEWHAAHPTLPIILLTTHTEEEIVIRGLSLGAIDYVRKPFGAGELMARIQRHLNADVRSKEVLKYKELTLNLSDFRAVFRNSPIEFTKVQFAILQLLMRRPGDTVTREQILDALDDEGEMLDRTIDSHISRLRTKLKKVRAEIKVAPVYGVGYRLE